MPRLADLARSVSLPILYFNANQRINQVEVAAGPDAAKRTFFDRKFDRPVQSAVDTIAQIESCSAWVQSRDVGADPEYAALLKTLATE
jgi:hypothetical protein